MKNFIKLPVILLLPLLLSVIVACDDNDENDHQEAENIKVPDHFGTIQEAIDASENGDVIIVKPGVYVENINFNGKEVVVQSTDPEDFEIVETTIIDGDENDCVVTIENSEGEGTVLSGFTIRNGSARDGAGIYIDNYSSPIIKNNYITENICGRGGGGGAFVTNGSSPKFKYNVFENNINGRTTSREGLGLFVRNESNVDIIGNEFINHDECWGVVTIGLGTDDNSNATISNNTIKNNTSEYGGGGIAVFGANAEIFDNTIKNNTGAGSGIDSGSAIALRNGANANIYNNTITENHGQNVAAIAIGSESEATITNNIITHNISGEEGDFSNGSGGGLYIDDAVANISDNTIENNSAWGSNTGGGGIYVNNSQVIIDNNIIRDNYTPRNGGGIYLRGHGETSTLVASVTNNTIEDNRSEGHSSAVGGGMAIGWISSATVYGNTVNNNYAEKYGGGIYIHEETPVYDDNNTEWYRMNYPPETEVHNSYEDNNHGDDEFHGRHVFFTDFSK